VLANATPQYSSHLGLNSADAHRARQIELLFDAETSFDFSSSTTIATPLSSATRSSIFCFFFSCGLIKIAYESGISRHYLEHSRPYFRLAW
jgi:hypothetical protein